MLAKDVNLSNKPLLVPGTFAQTKVAKNASSWCTTQTRFEAFTLGVETVLSG